MTVHTTPPHPTPPTQTQCQQYLSCYWPDFDETLKVGSWEHLEQTLTVTVTFVPATFVLGTFVHIRNISAVNWPNFDETLKVTSWEHLKQIQTIKMTFVQATFVLATFVHIRNISAVTDRCWPNFNGRFLEHFFNRCQQLWWYLSSQHCLGNICPYQEYLSCYWVNF